MCVKYFMYEIKDKSKLSTILRIVDEFIILIFPIYILQLLRDNTTSNNHYSLCIAFTYARTNVQNKTEKKKNRITPVYNLLLLYVECKIFWHKKITCNEDVLLSSLGKKRWLWIYMSHVICICIYRDINDFCSMPNNMY